MISVLDLKEQYADIKSEIDEAISEVVKSGSFILGRFVERFEEGAAVYLGSKYAMGVASGTDALHLALLACGVKADDEVITVPFTFFATAEVISNIGAKPVFVDIDPRTFNINPDKIEKAITSKTKAVIPVHLYGQSAHMDKIIEIAKKHNLKVIEDCAQSFGAEYKGRKTGAFGDCGCFSFFPTKNLGAYGDGGMIVTDSDPLAENIKLLRAHGSKDKYHHKILGFNSRLDAIQANILRVKLNYIDKWNKKRAEIAQKYNELIKNSDIITPYQDKDCKHVYHQYTARCRNKRDSLKKHLEEKGISTTIYYPISLHLQEVYSGLGYNEGDFPESEKAQREVLSLPVYPELSDDNIKYIAGAITEFGLRQV